MNIEILTLSKYSYGGEAFGRLADKRALFVPFALPGERVRVQIVDEKKGYARAELLEVLEASPDRIEARCPHFTHCGGCHYQHLPYASQLQAKNLILKDQLERIGKVSDPPMQPIMPSPDHWNYRNQVQFHLSPEGKLGFQAPRSAEIIPIQECHLPEEIITDVWPRLDLEAIPGLDRIILRAGAEEEILLVLESSDPEPVSLMVDLPISVIHSGPGGSLILAGDDTFTLEVKDRVFQLSAGSFFQVNTNMAGKMVEYILENLTIPEDAVLIDAYCGVGLFSAFLAPHVKTVVGIESSSSACEDFVTNLDEFDNVELYEAQVKDVLPSLEEAPEILLVDPPRAGLGPKTLDGILTLGPDLIVYVSCDPATLSRDVKRLSAGGYQLDTITPFDLFPQTFHIESISFFHKQ